MCFIENVSTDKEIALIIRNRSNSEKRHNYVLVNGSISEEMKNALKDRLGVDNEHGITYHTVNSFIDSAKAFKKSMLMRRAVAKVAEGDDFIVNGVVIDPFNTVEDIYSFETPYRYSSPVNVQDLINENALFIPMKRFATRSIAPIINGLYHAEGSVVFNRPVVAIIDPNKDFFETVKEASSYAVGKDYKIRSKVAEDRLAGRIFDRDTLIDQVAEIDQDFKVAVHYLKSLYHITPRLYVRDYSVGGARESQNPIVRDLEMVENLISHSSYSPNLQSIADFLKSVLAKDFSEWKIDAPSHALLVGLGEEEIKAYNDKLNIIRIFVSGNAYYADKKEKELQKIHEAFLHTKDNGLRSAVSDRVESIIEEINNIDKGDENE